jgi:hypothetical protein
MAGGVILERPSLDELRERHRAEIRALPDELREVTTAAQYPVTISDALLRRQRAAEQAVREREGITGIDSD